MGVMWAETLPDFGGFAALSLLGEVLVKQAQLRFVDLPYETNLRAPQYIGISAFKKTVQGRTTSPLDSCILVSPTGIEPVLPP